MSSNSTATFGNASSSGRAAMPYEIDSDAVISSADEFAVVKELAKTGQDATLGSSSSGNQGTDKSIGKTPSPSFAGRRRIENMPYVSPSESSRPRTHTPRGERGRDRDISFINTACLFILHI